MKEMGPPWMYMCRSINLEEGPPSGVVSGPTKKRGKSIYMIWDFSNQADLRTLKSAWVSENKLLANLYNIEYHFGSKIVFSAAPGTPQVSRVVASWLGEVIR